MWHCAGQVLGFTKVLLEVVQFDRTISEALDELEFVLANCAAQSVLAVEGVVGILAGSSGGRRLLSPEGGNRGVVAPDAVLVWCYGDCKLAPGAR